MSDGHLLVIEEDADIQNMLRIWFMEHEDFTMDIAITSSEVYEKIKVHEPKVIIAAAHLFGMKGCKFIGQLRKTTNTPHIPVVFIGCFDNQNRLSTIDDACGHPFDIEELTLRVKNCVERSK